MSGITVLVAFGPEHAHTIASGGLSKRDVQKFLFEHARNTVGTAFIPTFATSKSVTRKIEMPR